MKRDAGHGEHGRPGPPPHPTQADYELNSACAEHCDLSRPASGESCNAGTERAEG